MAACHSCRQHARLLARSIRPATHSELTAAKSTTAPYFFSAPAASPLRARSKRQFTASATLRRQEVPGPSPVAAEVKLLNERLSGGGGRGGGMIPKFGGQYILTAQLDRLYKICAAPAAYSISEELRQKDEVPRTEDGEELGVGQGPWLQTFNLSPSFSSWSHVTMLHMYLVIVRMRCLDRDAARSMQAQFVDNFFFDCERVMHINHGMTSSALRQRYLKDIFMQWRGLIAAYDEGIAKASDRVLAAAVWRNLFKAREDVDVRHLAAIVAWMRATLRDFEAMEVHDIISRSERAFRRDPRAMLRLVDEPSQGARALFGTTKASPAPAAGAGGASEPGDAEAKAAQEAAKSS